MATYTTVDLIVDVRDRAWLASASAVSDAEILRFATATLAPLYADLTALRQDYGVTYVDVPIVAGTARYVLPQRAMGDALREVQLVSPNGVVNVPRLEIEETARVPTTTSTPQSYYLDGRYLVLVPSPAVGQQYTHVRCWYTVRPPTLVRTIAVAEVLLANTTLQLTTGNTIPAALAVGGAVVDVWSWQSPYTAMQTGLLAAVAGGPTTFNLSATTPLTLPLAEYGDLAVTATVGQRACAISLAGTSAAVPLPDEARPALVSRTAARIRRAMGDGVGADSLLAEATEEWARTVAVLSPRSVGEPSVIVQRNVWPVWTSPLVWR